MNVLATLSLDRLIDALFDEPTVWVRLAAQRTDDQFRLGLLEMTAGEAPPAWQRRRWRYDSACLIASAVKGATAARWLKSRRLRLDPLRLDLGGLAEQVTAERRESWFAGLHEPLPWPSEVWRLTNRTEHAGHSWAELVADGAPAFLDFDRAASYFLGLGPNPNRNFSGSELVFRRQDRRGRIASVKVRAAELLVRIDGERLTGSTVHLGADLPGQMRAISRGHLVKLPLRDGLPAGAWVALSKGAELLDRRLLDVATPQAGVEVVIPPATRLEVLIAGGEGSGVEFKQTLPTDERRSVRAVMKTVAAFANGNGGTIVFGVADDGETIGLPAADAGPRARDRIAGWVRTWVQPLVDFETESVAVVPAKRRNVVLLTIAPGGRPPYGAGTTPADLTYYIRRGATTFRATPDVVRDLVGARSEPTTG